MGSMITVSWQVFHGNYDISWKLGYRKLVEDAIEWFMGKYDFDDECNFTVNLKTYRAMDCYGETQQSKKNNYEIDLATDQGLRDFLATLMHELVHVHQWEREEWEGDGEKEAEDKQYELADEFWKEGLIR